MPLFLIRTFLLAGVLLLHCGFVGKFTVDQHRSRIRFSIDYLNFLPVTGKFAKFSSRFVYSSGLQKFSSVIVEIDPHSINTGNPLRDEHIKTEGFFEVDRHNKMVFTGRSSLVGSNGEHLVSGTLQMKGRSKPVTAKVFVLEQSERHMVVRFEFDLDRKVFGLNPVDAFDVSDGLIGRKARVSGIFYSNLKQGAK